MSRNEYILSAWSKVIDITSGWWIMDKNSASSCPSLSIFCSPFIPTLQIIQTFCYFNMVPFRLKHFRKWLVIENIFLATLIYITYHFKHITSLGTYRWPEMIVYVNNSVANGIFLRTKVAFDANFLVRYFWH